MNVTPSPKIVVVGAGAIGSLIGGLLARAGEDVTLIGRPAQVEAIRARGLQIEGILGSLTIPVVAAERLEFHPDLVLLGVKTPDVEATCRQMKDLVQGVPLLTLQNGVRSDELVASVLPKENILSGVVMLNVQFLEPGLITYARSGALVIGEGFGRNGQRIREVQKLLGQAIRTEISDDIQGAHWTKLLVNNLANGLEAMAGIPVRECLQQAGLKRIGLLTLREGHKVIEKAGFKLARLPGVPPLALQTLIRAPIPMVEWVLSWAMGSLKTLSSTLQSLRRGVPTEIDYLNGEIVRLGQQTGVATPYNSKVVEIVHEVEKSHQFQTPDELVRRFPLR